MLRRFGALIARSRGAGSAWIHTGRDGLARTHGLLPFANPWAFARIHVLFRSLSHSDPWYAQA